MSTPGPDDSPPQTPDELGGLDPKDLFNAGLETMPPVTLPPKSADPDATIPVAGPRPSQPSAPQVELPLPEELTQLLPSDAYQVESFLGQGGMGAVYKGTQVRLKRPVAIKIMRRDFGKDHDFEARFEREAQAMAKLNHPNIVSVIDFGEAGPDYLYIVMELVDGADMMDVIRTGRMTQEMALSLLPQICDALQFAHDHGIVHRDIKPSNIMLTRDGRIKMADFGLAKRYDVESSFRTQTGTGMGTPDYAAPEQFDPHAQIDHRADIYALGVMIYQMITGQLPRGVWKPPSQRAEVAPQWDDIVGRAMQSDPADRYQKATEVKTDVSSISLAPVAQVSDLGGAKTPSSESAPKTSATPPASQPEQSGDSRRQRRATTNSRAAHLLGPIVGAAVVAAGAFLALQQPKPIGSFDPPRRTTSVTNSSGAGKATVGTMPAPANTSTPPTTAFASATKDAPFVNSLGMKFVPVPITGGPTDGQRVLFSVWETRVQDYREFAAETNREWPTPDFVQGPSFPAVMVSWEDATSFCAWLTTSHRKKGDIGASEGYRLPTDHEWSCAVGIGQEDAAMLPKAKDRKIVDVFPWGGAWPPTVGVGNFAGEEMQTSLASGKYSGLAGVIVGYRDQAVETFTEPSFIPTSHGLHHLSGNVWEWCADWFDREQKDRVLRGGAWNASDPGMLLSSARHHASPSSYSNAAGFRCVLAPNPPTANK